MEFAHLRLNFPLSLMSCTVCGRIGVYRVYVHGAYCSTCFEELPANRIGANSGHGHVWPRPDGAKARCGGPGLCAQCSRDQAIAGKRGGE